MGIENFFSSISENWIVNKNDKYLEILKGLINATHFMIDFNSIVYLVKAKILHKLNEYLMQILKGQSGKKADESLYGKIVGHMNAEEFHAYMNDSMISSIVLAAIEEYLLNMFKTYFDSKQLHHIFIGIDGVPTKSKMLEQRKRRYMGSFTAIYKNMLFEKYTKELSNNKIRFEYEKYKLDWPTQHITPGTLFMASVNSLLSSDNFKNKVKIICPNLVLYKFSGTDSPGEGETKIVNYLRTLPINVSDFVVIYSPDSDVTLLSLLLNSIETPKNKFYIKNLQLLRQNPQKKRYDLINIDVMSENIYKYVIEKLNKQEGEFDKHSIIWDIVFLLTVFGNDFVPKVDAFNIRNDFAIIIDKYIDILAETGKHIVVYSEEQNKKIISASMFDLVFDSLRKMEDNSLKNTYMANNYANYRTLLKTFDSTSLTLLKNISDFLKLTNWFKTDTLECAKGTLTKEKWNDRWQLEDKKPFFNILSRYTQGKADPEFYLSYCRERGEFPHVELKFARYSRSYKDKHMASRLQQYVPSGFPITSYDIESFQFENMLDQYVEKLNAEKLDIGFVDVDVDTENLHLIHKDMDLQFKEYYEKILEVKYVPEVVQNVAKEYMYGLVWVFEYYFNNYNQTVHDATGDFWYYRYTHAPLLRDVYQFSSYYLKHDEDYKEIARKLLDFKIKRSEFYQPIQQLFFVTPSNLLGNVTNSDFLKIINDHKKFFPDVITITRHIWKELHNSEIDCRGAIYLNKCNLVQIHNLDNYKDVEFLQIFKL